MNTFQIIFAIILHVTRYKSANADYINDLYEDFDNSRVDKYFVIVRNDEMNDINIEDQEDNNTEGKFNFIRDKNLKRVQRRFIDLKKDREKSKQAKLVKSQQERKIKELTDFMKNHAMTTNYLYDELRRIKRQKMVKDDLRRMIEYLEKPGKEGMRAKILKCYEEARKTEILTRDMWGLDTNNLVINVLKDPYNYGYIN